MHDFGSLSLRSAFLPNHFCSLIFQQISKLCQTFGTSQSIFLLSSHKISSREPGRKMFRPVEQIQSLGRICSLFSENLDCKYPCFRQFAVVETIWYAQNRSLESGIQMQKKCLLYILTTFFLHLFPFGMGASWNNLCSFQSTHELIKPKF